MIRVRACRCVRVCVLVCWNPACHLFVFVLLCLLVLLPYHVVCITPSLKLASSLLGGSHGTTAAAQQFCVDHYLAMRVLTQHMHVCCVRYGTCAFVGVCESVHLRAGTPHYSVFLYFDTFTYCAAAASVSCLCVCYSH